MATFIGLCRDAGVTDMRFSYAGGRVCYCDGYPAEQRSIVDGVLATYDPEAGPTLAEAQTAKISEAAASCDAVLDPLGAEYGAWEKQTWDQQASEAAALMADPTLETNTSAGDKIPCIRAMAAARGMAIAELAQRILVNRETWLQISGAVIGQRQAIYDRVQAATTVEAVAAIEVVIALPG